MPTSALDPQQFKAGFVAVMGRPNVGKSTLVNALLGQKIAAVSPRPQTTRKRQLGILTSDEAQIIFIDTPGVHKAIHKLGANMNKEAADTLQESDLILFLVDASLPPQEEDRLLARLLSESKTRVPVILGLNKIDLVSPDSLAANQAAYMALAPQAVPVTFSAVSQENLAVLISLIVERLRTNAPFFPEDQITDLYEREIAADLIREAALYILRDEIPHGIAIRIDEYLERSADQAYIEATVFVERESHKPIIIGQGGQMLKRIGVLARQKIEQMSGRKVYLQLRIKVKRNWRDDENVLRWFGY
jgi:GTPase